MRFSKALDTTFLSCQLNANKTASGARAAIRVHFPAAHSSLQWKVSHEQVDRAGGRAEGRQGSISSTLTCRVLKKSGPWRSPISAL